MCGCSDERAGEGIQQKIRNALESDGISFGPEKARPNLLLLDEIDGALNTDGVHT